MRKAFIFCLVAAFVAGACGDKQPKSSDANAAEVSTTSPETSGVASPSTPVHTGPVSFESAQSAFSDKRYGDAVQLFTTYTTEHPDNVWGQYMLGVSTWRTGDRDGAVSAFRRALEIDSTHVKSRLNLSRVLIEQGKAQEALPYVEAVLTSDSTSGEGYRLLGRVKDELGDTTGAVEAFKRAIVLDERDIWSMNNLGSLSIVQGKYADAIGPLARAIEIDSSVATFHNNLGVALEKSGYVTQAVDEYRAALAIDATYQKASRNLARVEGLPKDTTAAPAELGKLSQSFVEQVQSWR